MIKLLLPPNGNMKLDPKSVYILYVQLKNHFNGRQNVVARKWRLDLSNKSFDRRKDKAFFAKLSQKFNLKQLCLIFIGNLLSNQNTWVGDIDPSDAMEFYNIYRSRMASVESRYEDDIKSIYYFAKKLNLSSLKEIFAYNTKMNSSYIFKLLQNGMISYESFILLDSFLDIITKHDEHDDIIWSNYSSRIKCYKLLLNVDAIAAKSTFVEIVKASKY